MHSSKDAYRLLQWPSRRACLPRGGCLPGGGGVCLGMCLPRQVYKHHLSATSFADSNNVLPYYIFTACIRSSWECNVCCLSVHGRSPCCKDPPPHTRGVPSRTRSNLFTCPPPNHTYTHIYVVHLLARVRLTFQLNVFL